ncbi:MAG: ABC transporter permease, partial [Proteobacteria bacterium]|nr:ABC transporter permease [Pseudomonadota bacterium]
MNTHRNPWLTFVFVAFVVFLYGPMFVIVLLSFQGPGGGLTFPLTGLSFTWYAELARGLGVVDIGAALRRSLGLGLLVTVLTVVFSLMAGLAYRKRLPFGNALFYVAVASLIMPSIIVSLGIGLEFRLLDSGLKWLLQSVGADDWLGR